MLPLALSLHRDQADNRVCDAIRQCSYSFSLWRMNLNHELTGILVLNHSTVGEKKVAKTRQISEGGTSMTIVDQVLPLAGPSPGILNRERIIAQGQLQFAGHGLPLKRVLGFYCHARST